MTARRMMFDRFMSTSLWDVSRRRCAGWHDERVLDRVFLKPEHFGKALAGENLNVEHFLDGGLEIDPGNDAPAAEIDDGDATSQVLSSLGERDTVHGGR